MRRKLEDEMLTTRSAFYEARTTLADICTEGATGSSGRTESRGAFCRCHEQGRLSMVGILAAGIGIATAAFFVRHFPINSTRHSLISLSGSRRSRGLPQIPWRRWRDRSIGEIILQRGLRVQDESEGGGAHITTEVRC